MNSMAESGGSLASKNEDCYFFYYSNCTKGTSCPYRHEPAALSQEVQCKYWKKGSCTKPHCIFRHMDMDKKRDKIPCYWETQASGCQKPHCPFLHKKLKEPYPEVLQESSKIIVNKNRMEDFLNISDKEDYAESVNRRQSIKSRLGNPIRKSIKDRLGPLANPEADEAEELRQSAMMTMDLRNRLSTGKDTEEEVRKVKKVKKKEKKLKRLEDKIEKQERKLKKKLSKKAKKKADVSNSEGEELTLAESLALEGENQLFSSGSGLKERLGKRKVEDEEVRAKKSKADVQEAENVKEPDECPLKQLEDLLKAN